MPEYGVDIRTIVIAENAEAAWEQANQLIKNRWFEVDDVQLLAERKDNGTLL